MQEEQLRKISERLRRINRKRMRLFEQTVRDLKIHPSQHWMLMYLSREGHVDSQAKVADMLHISPARVTLVMKGLDSEGYIERTSGLDGRRNEIAITEKGQKMVEHSRVLFQELNAACFAGFTADEFEQFSGYLDRVLENLSRIEGEMMGDEET